MPLTPNLDHDQLKLLAEEYGTPYQLYDGDLIKLHSENYMKTFKKYFPQFKQYFAVKATPNPEILKLLKDCGMGFDCSSREEIKLVQHMDYTQSVLEFNFINKKKSEILFTSNYTSKEDLEFALKSNCVINLDSLDGLVKLIEITNQYEIKKLPLISFRFNPKSLDLNVNVNVNVNVNLNVKSNDFLGPESKFGLDKNNILEGFKLAKQAGFTEFGLHIMAKSCVLDIDYWPQLMSIVFELISDINKIYDINLKFIDIGGGIGIQYKPLEPEINLEELVIKLRKSFDSNMNKYNLTQEPQLFTECGRYITGKFGWLVAECKSIKSSHGNLFYGLDASMANLMRPGMYGAYHHITVPEAEFRNKNDKYNITIKANVVGTLCENNDWFAKFRNLPTGIKNGDLFVIHDTGAHGYSMGFNYNSKLRCTELLKLNGNIQCIRNRETFDDLIRNCSTYNLANFYIFTYLLFIFTVLFLLFIS